MARLQTLQLIRMRLQAVKILKILVYLLFQSLLSHKYGYTPFPRVIEADEFEPIVNDIETQEIKSLFHK